MALTTFTFNLANVAIRHETLQGRKYLVAPMAMLTEGVHNGSGGALLYKESECKKAIPAWNMKPIVVYHPEINGKGVSACDRDILEQQQVGMVLNTCWKEKLRAEAWIDEGLAETVDGRVLNALEENKIMEISTGLFTDNVGTGGDWNGTTYNAEAVNHQPDHLALLPDKIGACSIADGAGLLQLNEAAAAGGVDVTRLLTREMDTMRRMVGNAMSYANTRSALTSALRARMNTSDVWVEDLYENFFIYENDKDRKLYKLGHTASDTQVEITGEPVEVVRVTEYRTMQGDFVGNEARTTNRKKEHGMDKKKLVDGLIANAITQWGEDDREGLMNMEEAALEKMAPVENAHVKDKGKDGKDTEDDKDAPVTPAAPAAPVTPAAPAPVTMESFLAQAPVELRDVLTNGLDAHNAARDALVTKITTNENNTFEPEFLKTKSLGELQGLAALATPTENAPAAGPAMFYGGAATPAAPTANAENAEKPLVMPTMNWENGKK